MTDERAALPKWIRAAFWTVVALEWLVVVSVVALSLWVVTQLVLMV